MNFPKKVKIYEVGPREGFQIEEKIIPTKQKVEFVHAINETGIKSIEVTSFVNPKWVPNMADAGELLSQVNKKEGITYRNLYLNIQGLERAVKANSHIDGFIGVSASDMFAKRNTNKTLNELIENIPNWIDAYRKVGVKPNEIALMAAFGCNFEGEITIERVLQVITDSAQQFNEKGERLTRIKVCDTMGWANPEQVKRIVFAIRNKFPEMELNLHLHDTRGLGIANAYSALQEGIYEFESAIGGLGGCPFAAVKGAAGNIATEDLVFLCENLGIETGIDLEKLLQSVKLAEEIVARPLPGHLTAGGLLKANTNASV